MEWQILNIKIPTYKTDRFKEFLNNEESIRLIDIQPITAEESEATIMFKDPSILWVNAVGWGRDILLDDFFEFGSKQRWKGPY